MSLTFEVYSYSRCRYSLNDTRERGKIAVDNKMTLHERGLHFISRRL
jgi:hypothetical protein